MKSKYQEYIENINILSKKINSKKKAKKFLQTTGIYTKTGKLTRNYRD